jgi:hypothetical protein
MKDGISIPHLVDWRTKDSYRLADHPDANVSITSMNAAVNKITHKIGQGTVPAMML